LGASNIHGGPKQAILLIAIESIEKLKSDGFPLFAGALGGKPDDRRICRTRSSVPVSDSAPEPRSSN